MKYLKLFETEEDYNDFINSDEYVTPNIVRINSTKSFKFNPRSSSPVVTTAAAAGDVAYWDGSSVKTTPLSSWSTSLGTPIGVVVVPTGFAPDGKTRIIGLKPVDKNGNQSSSHVGMGWGPSGTDTGLINYTIVPTTDNAGSTSTGSNSQGYLPSDKFTGTTSYVDSKVKYYYDNYGSSIPSPYLGEAPNPEYNKVISGYNNALSDFNGLSNTQTLVGLGADYIAANAAYKYKDGASNLQWYLPAMGELGYIMPRFSAINFTIINLGGLTVASSGYLWSSSEHGSGLFIQESKDAFYVTPSSGHVSYYRKDYTCYMRPFAILDDSN